jgi:hypothetical protein
VVNSFSVSTRIHYKVEEAMGVDWDPAVYIETCLRAIGIPPGSIIVRMYLLSLRGLRI